MFFFNDTATTEIYTLSLHDALPIYGLREGHGGLARIELPEGPRPSQGGGLRRHPRRTHALDRPLRADEPRPRSEEHTSELQSRQYLVCRLLLEKKKIMTTTFTSFDM